MSFSKSLQQRLPFQIPVPVAGSSMHRVVSIKDVHDAHHSVNGSEIKLNCQCELSVWELFYPGTIQTI